MSKLSKGETTREHIIRSAIGLFNERGAEQVTTHDIAARAGLSPGNLYYHFENKEEIIRDAFERMDLFKSEGWREALEAGFPAFVDFYFSQVRDFRFLFRERASLLRSDPVLAERWGRAEAGLGRVMRKAAAHWVESGILKPFRSRAEVDAFIDNGWIILSSSYAFYEARGKQRGPALDRQVQRQLRAFLRPYHTAKGRLELKG